MSRWTAYRLTSCQLVPSARPGYGHRHAETQKRRHTWTSRGSHRIQTVAAPAVCGLAPRADRFLFPFLFRRERPLEEGQGRGLGLAVPSLGRSRFFGHELGPGEQRLLPLGLFLPVVVAIDRPGNMPVAYVSCMGGPLAGRRCAKRRPAPVASAWRNSPAHQPGASPTPGPGCRTPRDSRIPPPRTRAPDRRPAPCRRQRYFQPPAHRRRAPPPRSSFFQAITFTSAGTTSSAAEGWDRTACSFLSTFPEGMRWPFIIWEIGFPGFHL